jgi:hypothetical protein
MSETEMVLMKKKCNHCSICKDVGGCSELGHACERKDIEPRKWKPLSRK